MTDSLEEKVASIEVSAELCGAVVLDFDLEKDEFVFIWCGPGILMGVEIKPEMTAEDYGLDTLAVIHISDDPEFNGAADMPADSPLWEFKQIGELTPAQRSQTCLWVQDEQSLVAANPQPFRH
jgi:hypothetical protein